MNGIQEVVGSIPISSTTLRSGRSPELRVASHSAHHDMLGCDTPQVRASEFIHTIRV